MWHPPAGMRAEAEAEAAKGPFGMAFLTYNANTEASAFSCGVETNHFTVPAAQPVDSPVDTAGRRRRLRRRLC